MHGHSEERSNPQSNCESADTDSLDVEDFLQFAGKMMATSRKRNANFTTTEFNALIDSVEKYQSVILSKVTDVITKPKKDAVWRAITAHVNSSSRFTCERSVKEIKKKWNDTKSRTKKRASMAKANPNLEPQLTSTEEKILAMINSTSTNGVDEGIDTDEATLPSTSSLLNIPDDDPAYTTVYVEEDEEEPAKPNHFPAIPPLYNTFGDKILMEKLISVKKARLEVEKERLEVEKARLQVEQKRLRLEEKRLILKEKRFCYL